MINFMFIFSIFLSTTNSEGFYLLSNPQAAEPLGLGKPLPRFERLKAWGCPSLVCNGRSEAG
jgi:hypothetical protein